MANRRELVVGCFTPGAYEEVAKSHLIHSLQYLEEAYGIRLESVIRQIPDRGSWILNNSACQLYLREIDKEFPDADLLYCDVDAMVRADPFIHLRAMREQYEFDIAAHYIRTEKLLTGSYYLPVGPNRTRLLADWIAANERQPNRWDQENLEDLLPKVTSVLHEIGGPFESSGGFNLLFDARSPYKVLRLPPEFCFIFDMSRAYYGNKIRPIIEHFQASRKHKY